MPRPTLVKTETKNKKFFRHLLSTPFIWGMVIPVIVLHLCMFVYQAAAFRLYGLGRVQFRKYCMLDRQKLSYLSLFDKLNCAYCSYVNGVFAYVSEIGHRTEYYWCGVKHFNQPNNPVFAYQDKFAAYGSEEEYCKILVKSGRRIGKN